MPSTSIYNLPDRTPYTYFIRWNELDLNYYGRRTAKDCRPEEFFVKYFTSSKLVWDVIAEHGMPDVIKIHKIFVDVDSCKIQEERFLKRVNAARSLRWLNQTNGDKKWDLTGKIVVQDTNGTFYTIDVTDSRYVNKELLPYRANKVVVKDKNGNTSLIDKNNALYTSGELIPIGVGNLPWNTGLSKDTDDRLYQAAIKRSKTTKGVSRGPHTESRKENISKTKSNKKFKWFNNGTIELSIPQGEIIPENFVSGRLPQKRNMKVICRIFDMKEMDIGNYIKWERTLINNY
jgi:hypothetical protein